MLKEDIEEEKIKRSVAILNECFMRFMRNDLKQSGFKIQFVNTKVLDGSRKVNQDT